MLMMNLKREEPFLSARNKTAEVYKRIRKENKKIAALIFKKSKAVEHGVSVSFWG